MAGQTVSVIVLLIGLSFPCNFLAQEDHFSSFTIDEDFQQKHKRQVSRDEPGCRLPQPLSHGQFLAHERRCPPADSQPSPACRLEPDTVVPPGWVLKYTCSLGYQLNTSRIASICLQQSDSVRWLPPLPKCLESSYDSLKNFESVCGTHSSNLRTQRKVDGTVVKRGAYPWMVIFGHAKSANPRDGMHWFCAGTLVTSRHVITAAHCVAPHRHRPLFFARLDDINLDVSGEDGTEPIDIEVEKILIIPDYDENIVFTHNLAIVILKTAFQITDYVKPICLPTSDLLARDLTGADVRLVSWGQTDNDREISIKKKRRFEPILHEMSAKIMDHQQCSDNYTRLQLQDTPIVIGDDQICARVEVNRSCQGDIGSPLMLNHDGRYILIGVAIPIARNNRGCFDGEEFPRIFTKISFYMQWIVSNLKFS